MIVGIEQVLVKEKPQAIVVYGDTNSTLAGAIAASKMHIPVIHIEAGLRSFNKKMPEEINRILCDHASTLLFTPTLAGITNLVNEGFKTSTKPPHSADKPGIFHCGDIMYDNSLYFSQLSESKSDLLSQLNLSKNNYLLATIHRNDNTDVPEHLSGIFNGLLAILGQSNYDIVLPLHPRTKKLLSVNLNPELLKQIEKQPRLKLIEPVSFLEMIFLEKNAFMILTDSGGVQKEAYFFNKPCIILRPETEWVELVECGAALLVSHHSEKIISAFNHFSNMTNIEFKPIFGDGHAAEFICSKLIEQFS
jgi:UDP-GlcNAc3NAcA epimerase